MERRLILLAHNPLLAPRSVRAKALITHEDLCEGAAVRKLNLPAHHLDQDE